jgi:aminocarboxymuconate-semialdehyde decarboxylase
MAIDPHAHIIPEAWIEDIRAGRLGSSVSIVPSDGMEQLVTRFTVLGQERTNAYPLPRETYDVEMRLKDMKRMGVERQILSIVPVLMFYSADPGLSLEIAVSLNDALCGLAQKHPGAFSCMATGPLHDPEAAAKELDRAVKRGHVGVQIGANVAGKNLDEPALDPFWAKAAELDVPIFIHPAAARGFEDRLQKYYLSNFIGNPLDTTVSVACLIFGGVLDRFPSLKFLLSHTGGFTPWIRGRWQHGYGERKEPKVHGAKDPEQYVRKLYYDTIIHNADCLEFAARTLGAGNLVYGTDYPFDMGDLGPAREIPGLSRLSPPEQEKILSGNARSLYRL